jgi:hypothetical protein
MVNWTTTASLFSSFMQGVELGQWDWSDKMEFKLLKAHALAARGASKPTKMATATSKGEPSAWFCREYQRDKCTEGKNEHWGYVGETKRWVKHFCSNCFKLTKTEKSHPSSTGECPNPAHTSDK